MDTNRSMWWVYRQGLINEKICIIKWCVWMIILAKCHLETSLPEASEWFLDPERDDTRSSRDWIRWMRPSIELLGLVPTFDGGLDLRFGEFSAVDLFEVLFGVFAKVWFISSWFPDLMVPPVWPLVKTCSDIFRPFEFSFDPRFGLSSSDRESELNSSDELSRASLVLFTLTGQLQSIVLI